MVRSVPNARDEALGAGGGFLGEVVGLTTSDGRRVTWCYLTDPEGNVIELQNWE